MDETGWLWQRNQWNTDEVKTEREAYAQWLLNTGTMGNLIFVDEFGSDIWTARTQGRAPVGERAVRIVEGQRGQNLTLCLAVSPVGGLIHWMFVETSFGNLNFVDFLVEVEALVDAPFTMLCGNARPKKTAILSRIPINCVICRDIPPILTVRSMPALQSKLL
jgi:hypothetical protein